jgi:hypothetical protein
MLQAKYIEGHVRVLLFLRGIPYNKGEYLI